MTSTIYTPSQKRQSNFFKKVYNINIDRDMHLASHLQVLAHEMIHVQQIATKRFQQRV